MINELFPSTFDSVFVFGVEWRFLPPKRIYLFKLSIRDAGALGDVFVSSRHASSLTAEQDVHNACCAFFPLISYPLCTYEAKIDLWF